MIVHTICCKELHTYIFNCLLFRSSPPQVECRLLISSIFDAMNFQHFRKCYNIISSISKKCWKFIASKIIEKKVDIWVWLEIDLCADFVLCNQMNFYCRQNKTVLPSMSVSWVYQCWWGISFVWALWCSTKYLICFHTLTGGG